MAQDTGVLNHHCVNRGVELWRPRSQNLRKIWRSIENWWKTNGIHWPNQLRLPKHRTFAKEPEVNGSTSSSNPPRGSSAPSSLLQPPNIEGRIVPEVGSVGLPQILSVNTIGPSALAPGQRLVERYRNVLFTNGESNRIARRMFLDIGADANFMVERVQKIIGAELKPCERSFAWGDGNEITHIGEVEVDWYFEGKGATYTTNFVVIPGPAWFDTLLGYASINEYKLLIENDRVCAVRHANEPGVEAGFNDE